MYNVSMMSKTNTETTTMKILLATIALLIGSAAFAQSAPVVIGNGAYLLQACQIQARVDSGTQTNGTANDFIAAG